MPQHRPSCKVLEYLEDGILLGAEFSVPTWPVQRAGILFDHI
jgi:hypothetical protein